MFKGRIYPLRPPRTSPISGVIDLHAHSTASDGSLSPTALVARAAECGLGAIALVDHDTTAGVAEAQAAAAEFSLELVPGCELSAEFGTGELHLLGLYLDPLSPALAQALGELRTARHARNRIIIDKLKALGARIDYETVLRLAGDGAVGRPHIAQALVESGFVQTRQDAFNRLIGNGGKAYAPKTVFSPAEAIRLLKAAGASVMLAHPGLLHMAPKSEEALIDELVGHGLDGIEAIYSEHTPAQTDRLLALARRKGLIVSGGSDFHGSAKPHIELGCGRGSLTVPDAVLDAIKARRREQGLPV